MAALSGRHDLPRIARTFTGRLGKGYKLAELGKVAIVDRLARSQSSFATSRDQTDATLRLGDKPGFPKVGLGPADPAAQGSLPTTWQGFGKLLRCEGIVLTNPLEYFP